MKLLFLTYINRSGSTFLANMFSKSPDVLVCPEGEVLMNELLVHPGHPFDFNNSIREKFARLLKEDPKLKYWNLSDDIIDNLPKSATNFEIFVSILTSYKEQTKPEASVVLFKAERLIHLFDNLENVGLQDDVFLLSIIRDCRGVYASQKQTKFPDTEKYMSRNPVETAVNWKIHINKALKMQQARNLELIRYEELILDVEIVFSSLLVKLGIPVFEFQGKKGDLFDRLPESHKGIHTGILEKPLTEKGDNWKNVLTKTEQCIIEIVAGMSLATFNKSLNKQICPIFTWSLLGYYFMEYVFMRMIKKIHFYWKNIIDTRISTIL